MMGLTVYTKPDNQAVLHDGWCYVCKKSVKVLHIKPKGQYICSQCGSFEASLPPIESVKHDFVRPTT